MKLRIAHQMSIGIGEGAPRAVQHLLLTPRNHGGQTVREWTVDGPGVTGAARFTDAYGNTALLVNQSKPEAQIVVSATGTVETVDRHGVVGRVVGDPVPALFTRMTAATKDSDPALIEGLDGATRDRVALFHTLMARVGDGSERVDAQTRSQDGQSQSQSQSHATSPGKSTELAHAFIGALRALHLPARFVTGYVAADEDDAAEFRSWAEAYDERLGWIGFDCVLQLCPTERHVRLAIGLDATSAAPVRSVPGSEATKPMSLAVEAAQ